MEEENKVNAPVEESTEDTANKGGYEPHGSASAPRPGDRKDGSHRGRPSERRGGRGGFRNGNDDGLTERVVAINRVSKTVQGGKHVRFSALAVVGDGKGKYGFAMTKSGEVPDAIKKSLAAARKYMMSVQLVKGTIAHDVEGVYGATKVVLKPAPAGTGIVASIPLIFFTIAAVNLPMNVLGFCQYISPILTLLLGILFFNERFGWAELFPLLFIWSGIAAFLFAEVREHRKAH